MESRIHAIQGQVLRAKRSQTRGSTLRRETLALLIRTPTSVSAELKKLAAKNIQCFFKDFPDLEESAINAVYDLCEDQSSEIRIEGYRAITSLSKADHRLVKRNADVLLQLLQSDEPEEVIVVKDALLEHIDLDPRGSLSVLCDQLIPIDGSVDEEERDMRIRVRNLVSGFLTDEAMGTVSRHIKGFKGLETMFLQSILGLIPQLNAQDMAGIVNRLVSGFSKFKVAITGSWSTLISNRISTAVQNDLKLSPPCLLSQSRLELQVAHDLTLNHKILPTLDLLQIYCQHLVVEQTLRQLALSEQQWVLNMMTTVLSSSQAHAAHPDFVKCQSSIIDSCPYLIELMTPGVLDQFANPCCSLLRICLQRKNSQGWTLPPALVSALQALKQHVDKSPPRETKRELQKMIMFLLPPTADGKPKGRGRVMQTATKSTSSNGNASCSIIDEVPQASTSKPNSVSPPPLKKRKASTETTPVEPPRQSLLSRLQPATPVSAPAPAPVRAPAPQVAPRATSSLPPKPDVAMPVQGFSIKGAAAGVAQSKPVAVPRKVAPPQQAPSLLDRLNGANSFSSNSGFSATVGGSEPKKRKRGPNR